jgi:hypothetical protein
LRRKTHPESPRVLWRQFDPRKTSQGWWVSSGVFLAVGPCGVFVVFGVVFEASVKDADETVSDCS